MSIRVLLTNDDGIHAPGLAALERAFSSSGEIDLWVVAPDRERSTCSHGMTIARPIFTQQHGPQRVAVDGLTADCVYFGMFGLMPEMPHVVVSGINNGPNLGRDVIYSGTVAGAREAAAVGVHGLAVSLFEGSDFDRAAQSVVTLVEKISRMTWYSAVLLNLNYPAGAFSGPRLAPLGNRTYPQVVNRREAELSGRPYYWLGGPPIENELTPRTDVWLVDKGIASATPLVIDQTDRRTLSEAGSPVATLFSPTILSSEE